MVFNGETLPRSAQLHFLPPPPPPGLSIHTFHGNFFVRSTDLLSLANVNPDSAFAVQMSIEDSLADSSLACFQAALLYTSSKGTRSHDTRPFFGPPTLIAYLAVCPPPLRRETENPGSYDVSARGEPAERRVRRSRRSGRHLSARQHG